MNAPHYIIRSSYKKDLTLVVSLADDITGQTKTLTLNGYDAMEVSEAIKAGNPALRLVETPKGVKITYRVEAPQKSFDDVPTAWRNLYN